MKPILFFILIFSIFFGSSNGECGDGVLDAGEICDSALVSCCNATCTGYHNVIDLQPLSEVTCFSDVALSIVQLFSLIDSTSSVAWSFSRAPVGSNSIFTTPNLTSTQLYFDGNGEYEIEMAITTQLCGTYYSSPLKVSISDCCGNDRIDHGEQCDPSVSQSGCCNEYTCSYLPLHHSCTGVIEDECTESFSCASDGTCNSEQNLPFSLTALQPTEIVDTTCGSDMTYYSFLTQYADSDLTFGGAFTWEIEVLSQSSSQHQVWRSSENSLVINNTILMIGGGSFVFRLDVWDRCELHRYVTYSITRNCCGNLVINTGETCDDGNQLDGDYCNGQCTEIIGTCGDGIVQTNEICDIGSQLCCGKDCRSFAYKGTVCRDTVDICDALEVCPGNSGDCPPDTYLNSTIVCQQPYGLCGAGVTCSGYGPGCPAYGAVLPSTYQCRKSKGQCDLPEFCDNVTAICPPDLFSSELCRKGASQCDVPEYCDSINPKCPPDLYANSSVACIADGAGCKTAHCFGLTTECVVSQVEDCIETIPLQNLFPECLATSCQEGGVCVDEILPGSCFIDGACYSNRESNPANSCQMCMASSSQTVWSNAIDGSFCHTLSPSGPCSGQDVCLQGVCTDVYLPSTSECRAIQGDCDEPEFCTESSDDCPLDQWSPPTKVCRPAEGDCDATETCSGYGINCPPNTVLPNTFVCRPMNGTCDIPDTCDGVNKVCPRDLFQSNHFVCREARGNCDKPETCPGDSGHCPRDEQLGPLVPCRFSRGDCDPTEFCPLNGIHCPPDLLYDTNIECRPARDKCDAPEFCTKVSVHCPYDFYLPLGTVCRPANGTCDQEEKCDGVNTGCPVDIFKPQGEVCRAADGQCDRPEVCSGDSTTCPDDLLQSTDFECRPALSFCDQPEFCNNRSRNCPVDQYLPSTTTCRGRKGPCDAVENCTGSNPFCPADLKQPSSFMCYQSPGPCAKNGFCDSVTDDCPPPFYLGTDVPCRNSTGGCDPVEYCPSTSDQCPDDIIFDNSVICAQAEGVCGLPTFCPGNGNPECPTERSYRSADTPCHLATNQCDRNVNCSGSSSFCPLGTFAPRGTQCDQDGLNCTDNQCDGKGSCNFVSQHCQCARDSDCVANGLCIIPKCIGYMCQQSVIHGYCFIDGQCWTNGTSNPSNDCLWCRSDLRANSWTAKPVGSTCDTINPKGPCSAPDTCNQMGQCVDQYKVGEVCRVANGTCDIPDSCQAGNDFCPTDAFRPSSFVCHWPVGTCEVKVFCSGVQAQCPSGIYAPATQMCRKSEGDCDPPEYCTSYSGDCPPNLFYPSDYECRSPSGPCDKPEYCIYGNATCPLDEVQPITFQCFPSRGQCDRGSFCDAKTKGCPPPTLFPSTHICRLPKGPCDKPDQCDGYSIDCPLDELYGPETPCRLPEGECDLTEYCDEASIWCPDDLKAPQGTPCRFPKGGCDKMEVCPGGNVSFCPEDEFMEAGTVCRGAKDKCDVEEVCHGTVAGCPFDLIRPNGYSCSDGIFCNGDEFCQSGGCVRVPRNCSLAPACKLLSRCDEQSQQCLYVGLVGSLCYEGPNGTANVGACRPGTLDCLNNGSLVCTNQILPGEEICDNGIDDNCNDIIDEGCVRNTCVASTDCVVEGPCRQASCEDGFCVLSLAEESCFIDGTCYLEDQPSPFNPCKFCSSLSNGYGWTMDDTRDISDGNVCNGVEKCKSGFLYFNPKPLSCNSANADTSCIDITCDPVLGCQYDNKPDNSSCFLSQIACSEPTTCVNGVCTCSGMQRRVTSMKSLKNGAALFRADGDAEEDEEDNWKKAVISLSIIGTTLFVLVILLVSCILIERAHMTNSGPLLTPDAKKSL